MAVALTKVAATMTASVAVIIATGRSRVSLRQCLQSERRRQASCTQLIRHRQPEQLAEPKQSA
jgi:hypothetical protein